MTVQPFDFQSSIFGSQIKIPTTSQIVFVADLFVEDYVGGAELTTEALIKSSPYEVFKIKSKDVTMELLQDGVDRFWIFGNFAELNPQLLPSIVANMRYSVLEYDYKFCRSRSPEKHFQIAGTPCDCASQMNGKMVSAFYYGSMGLWWMSEAQRDRYLTTFPFLEERSNVVLSSVFDSATLQNINRLKVLATDRKGWIVLGSSSWIKGADDAEAWCKANGKDYEVVWNLPYEDLLEKLSRAEGFVYLPKGGDTCPRMVIEAKLLGCQLHLNDNVQHKSEKWFATDDLNNIITHLEASPQTFWSGIKAMKDYRPTVSGYTTTYNAVKQEYPFIQCITSMLAFCDEVCVVDGGSTDGTLDSLACLAYPNIPVTIGSTRFVCDLDVMIALAKAAGEDSYEFPDTLFDVVKDPRIKVKVIFRDWSSKRHPVFDGMQKAEARAMCTKEFCWQMDADEVVHEEDYNRVAEMARTLPKGVDILALPVIEYWGGEDKVRLDIQPWKWRLSRNAPHITHGIPKELRASDADGPYSLPGSDGCDMVHKETGDRLPHVSFYSPEVENARRAALMGNAQAKSEYEQWFNSVTKGLPSVFHYSWYDLPRKIKLYRDYWQNHWNALWNKDTSDTAANNLMFGIPWKDVTDEMIESRAAEMKEKLGGWIWHQAWDGKATTPHIVSERSQPAVMS